MRVAITYDYLNQYGGGERVLEEILKIFPEADIFTIFYDEINTHQRFKDYKLITSKYDFKFIRNNHRLFIPILPFISNSLKNNNNYDIILSLGASFGKGILYKNNSPKFLYCFTPLRYAWENNYLPPKKWLLLIWPIVKLIQIYLKKWDYNMQAQSLAVAADSIFIQEKIRKYYNRNSVVIYPPIDLEFFKPDANVVKKDYFLALGRLIHYKRFDLIIEAFNTLNYKLRIIGSGPEFNKLKNLIKNPLIKLEPFIENEIELRNIYRESRALIFPQIEDFGLVAAESLACGTPIIGRNIGGTKEIINNNTGIFIHGESKEEIKKAIDNFIIYEPKFNRDTISKSAQKFGRDIFKREIMNFIKEK